MFRPEYRVGSLVRRHDPKSLGNRVLPGNQFGIITRISQETKNFLVFWSVSGRDNSWSAADMFDRYTSFGKEHHIWIEVEVY